MQRAGDLRTFDLNKYLLHQQTKGYSKGGSLSPAPPAAPQTPIVMHDDSQTRRLADILDRLDRDGLPVFLGLDEWDAKQELRNRIRNLAKKE